MNVQLVKFYPFETSLRKPRLLGYADVELDGILVLRNIKLFESKYGGYFIPKRWKKLCHNRYKIKGAS